MKNIVILLSTIFLVLMVSTNLNAQGETVQGTFPFNDPNLENDIRNA